MATQRKTGNTTASKGSSGGKSDGNGKKPAALPKRNIGFDLSGSPKKKKKSNGGSPNLIKTWGTLAGFIVVKLERPNGDSAYMQCAMDDLRGDNSILKDNGIVGFMCLRDTTTPNDQNELLKDGSGYAIKVLVAPMPDPTPYSPANTRAYAETIAEVVREVSMKPNNKTTRTHTSCTQSNTHLKTHATKTLTKHAPNAGGVTNCTSATIAKDSVMKLFLLCYVLHTKSLVTLSMSCCCS